MKKRLTSLVKGKRDGHSWESLRKQAQAAAAQDPTNRVARALAAYYDAGPPPATAPLSELPLLAVDVETTGLDVRKDSMVSLGFVAVDGRRIPLGSARHWLIKSELGATGVGDSATIHGITDAQLAQATPLDEVLVEVLTAARGRALLAHLALIEHDFISAACERRTGVPWVPVAVDTMDLERRAAVSCGRRPGRGEVRLVTARHSRGLPEYRSHNALSDALACAELYLAQTEGGRFGNDLNAVLRRRGTTQW